MRSYWNSLLWLTLAAAFSASLLSIFFGSATLTMVPVDFRATAVNQDTLETFKTALIGLTFSEDETDKDPHKITRERLPQNTRIIPKGAFVTMDYVADRLNLKLDEQMKVKQVTIG